jgi:hypothetical protein
MTRIRAVTLVTALSAMLVPVAAEAAPQRDALDVVAARYDAAVAALGGYGGVRLVDGAVEVSAVGDDAPFRSEAARSGQGYPFAFRAVGNPMSDLLAVRDRLAARADGLAADGIVLTSWGPDVVTNTVRVGVTDPSPSVAGRLVAEFGPALRVEHGRPPASASRLYDTSPWEGGEFTALDNGSDCTSGPAVYKASTGKTYLLTAGHCYVALNTGLSGYTYRTFQGSHQMGTGSSPFMGWTAVERVNLGYDDALIDATASKYDWRTGLATAPPGTAAQTSAQGSVVGASVCASGAFSGERCGATVMYVNQDTRSFNGVIHVNMVAARNSGVALAGPGDSGAPVYQVHGTGLIVTGLLIEYGDDLGDPSAQMLPCPQNDQAGRGSVCTDVIWYHDIVSVLSHLGVTLKTT